MPSGTAIWMFAGEIGGLRGEDEFEQAPQRHRCPEARHHHDDERCRVAEPRKQHGIERQRERRR